MPFSPSPRVVSCRFSLFHWTGLGVPADPNLAACGIHVMASALQMSSGVIKLPLSFNSVYSVECLKGLTCWTF